MAISTYKVFLMMQGEDLAYAPLIPIKQFPDLMQAPENLETTTFSDSSRTYIPGIQESENLEFQGNYDKSDFQRLKDLEGQDLHLAVWLGGDESGSSVTPTGSEGRFEFVGRISVSVSGGGVNEVVNMTITVTPSTDITVRTRMLLSASLPATKNQTGYLQVTRVYAASTNPASYQWEESSDGETWTVKTGSDWEGEYVPATALTVGKYYRCRVKAQWSNPTEVDYVYTNNCLAVSGSN